ncbi:MAG TPA: META domain-containing protein [Gemmatimonadales bacterium]|jgi:heat shock protein HslJ|nr:META domain-containing protein [Gemmatimonadales bacterium]
MTRMPLTMLAAVLAACSSPRAGAPAADTTASASAADSAAPPAMADSTPAAPAAALEGTQWRLVEIGGQPSPPGADSARHPGFTLLSEGRKIQGSAGCNRMTGTYELDGTKLKFGPMATTRMACPAMATETAFLKALDATTRYELSGTSLTLFGGDTAVARLEPAAKPN